MKNDFLSGFLWGYASIAFWYVWHNRAALVAKLHLVVNEAKADLSKEESKLLPKPPADPVPAAPKPVTTAAGPASS